MAAGSLGYVRNLQAEAAAVNRNVLYALQYIESCNCRATILEARNAVQYLQYILEFSIIFLNKV